MFSQIMIYFFLTIAQNPIVSSHLQTSSTQCNNQEEMAGFPTPADLLINEEASGLLSSPPQPLLLLSLKIGLVIFTNESLILGPG